MADWLKPIAPLAPLARGRAVVRTPPVLARYLEDLAKADRLAGDWDALAAAARGIDEVQPPRAIVPPADYGTAVSSMMPSSLGEPLADMLLENDRRRALIGSRLERLTPEQQSRSLPVVGRQYESDQAAARAADISSGRNRDTAAVLGAAGVLGAGAFGARLAQESDRNRRDSALLSDLNMREQLAKDVQDIPIGADDGVYVPDVYVGASVQDIPDLFAEDAMLPITSDVDEIGMMDQLADDYGSISVPSSGARMPLMPMPRAYAGTGPESMRRDVVKDMEWTFLPTDSEESWPDGPVSQTPDMEDLPGPQLRSVKALISAGIPAGRAMDIITKGSSMSPDEYRMVTGGRR